MRGRYVLAPEAALDLVEIWRYIREQSSEDTANRIESVIRERIVFRAKTPGAGHSRKDLTAEVVKFFPSIPISLPIGQRRNRCRWLQSCKVDET